MKTIFALLATLSLSAATVYAQPEQKAPALTIKIDGIRNNNGKIMVALGDYRAIDKMIGTMTDSDSTGVTCTFETIPTGKYKIYTFHDENGNFQMERGADGRPLEGFGTDNNGSWEPEIEISDKPQDVLLRIVYPTSK